MARTRKTPLERMAARRGIKTSSSSSKKEGNTLEKQVQNYETRLKNIGKDPKEATDSRNALEKFLGLQEDQNVLFDVFELLGRPQQALFGAIDAAQKGEDIGQGAWEGFKGDRYTYGGELLRNAGMEDSEGVGLDDILGFGLDIFADPMSIVPVKGFSAASKALKAGDKLSDARKLLQTGDDVVAGLAKKGAKKAVGVSDNLISKGLGKIDEKNLAKIQDFAKANKITEGEAARILNIRTGKLDVYNDLKKLGRKAVNSSEDLGGLVGKSRTIEATADLSKSSGKILVKDLDNRALEIARKMTNTEDEALQLYDEIAKKLNTAVESGYDWTIKGDEVIGDLKAGKKTDLFNEENAKTLANELKKYGVKADVDGRFVKINSKDRKLGLLQTDKKLRDSFSDLELGQRLSKEDITDIEEAMNFFNQSDELKSLYNEANSTISNIAKKSDELTGLQAQNITKEGYVPHLLAQDEDTQRLLNVGRSADSTKGFRTRKYNMTTNEYNRLKEAENLAKRQKGVAQKSKFQADIYKTDDAGELILDADGKPIRDDSLYKEQVASKKKAIQNYNANKTSAEELLRYRETGQVDVTKLTEKDQRRLKVIKSTEDLQETVNKLNNINVDDVVSEAPVVDVNNAFKEVKKAQNKLAKALSKDASEDTIKSLENSLKEASKELKIKTNILQNYAQKAPRNELKKVVRAFDTGKDVGEKLQKAKLKLKNNLTNVNEIYQSAADISTSLKSKIAYEEAALRKIKDSKDVIFERRLKQIDDLTQADNILSSAEGKEFMSTNFFTNLDGYVNKSAKFNKAAQVYNEALVTGIFRNSDYVKTIDDLADGRVPYGFREVNGTQLKKKLEYYKGILPENSKAFFNTIDDLEGKRLFVDEDLLNMLELSQNATKNQLHPLLKMWDGLNNTFKKFSTVTLGFQMRNMIGNSTNMVLSGVPAKDLPNYYKKAASLWNKADDLQQKFVRGTLTDAEKVDWDILEQFYKGGFSGDTFTKIQGLEDIKKAKKGPINAASNLSIKANETVDRYNRLALLMYANDNPSYVAKLGKTNAIDTVKHVLFDPNNMSSFEKNVMKRAMPFYTFTKQNLMFQADNLLRNTPRYHKFFKALNASYDALPEDSYYQYQKDSMQIPLPITDDNGNQMFLKANLPLSDLGEWLENPMQRMTASTSPLIKVPYEMVSGVDTFTGQKSNKPAVERLLTGLGLQNVSTNLYKKIEAIYNNYNGDIDNQQMWAEIFRSLVQNNKQESVRNVGLYEDLQEYQALIQQLKEQGTDVPTITEINAANKVKLNNMKRKRARR